MQAFLVQWNDRECTRRRSRSSVHRRIPNTHSVTDLSESHGASQIEVPNIGNANNASLQRGENSRWHGKAGARRAQCQAKETGRIEEKVRENATRQKNQCSPPHHVEAKGNGAWGASVYKTWQISPICSLLVEGPSCLTEPSAFTTNLKVGPR